MSKSEKGDEIVAGSHPAYIGGKVKSLARNAKVQRHLTSQFHLLQCRVMLIFIASIHNTAVTY